MIPYIICSIVLIGLSNTSSLSELSGSSALPHSNTTGTHLSGEVFNYPQSGS